MFRSPSSWLTCSAFLLCYAQAAIGFESGSEPPANSAAAKPPLPRHYDQLALTSEQESQVRQVQDEYDGKIDSLRRKLKALRGRPFVTGQIVAITKAIQKLIKERDRALEENLTESQRTKLRELRKGD